MIFRMHNLQRHGIIIIIKIMLTPNKQSLKSQTERNNMGCHV